MVSACGFFVSVVLWISAVLTLASFLLGTRHSVLKDV